MAWQTVPTLVVQLGNADATVLTASSTAKRRIRNVRVVNTNASGGAAATFTMAINATTTDATSLYKGKTVAANDSFSEFFSPGIHFNNTIIRAFASAATTLNLHLTYEEEPVT